MAAVSLIIPTFRRPEGLARAVRSAFRQDVAAELELVVVDNDPAGSAREACARLAEASDIPLRYVHEPAPGVANARNAGLAAARAPLIAFLDDDEEAPRGWLSRLLAVQAETGADVVFGPVQGRAPEGTPHRRYLEAFFSRTGPDRSGLIEHFYGCGNSLVLRAALPGRAPFPTERNHIGGEDDLVFARMQARGRTFAWAAGAFVWEDPAPERLTLAYTVRRAFAYGQGPSAACAARARPDWAGVGYWMARGLLQAAGFGLLAAGQALAGRDYAPALDRAARGLGKTLWWGPFKIEFYGRGRIRDTAGAAA